MVLHFDRRPILPEVHLIYKRYANGHSRSISENLVMHSYQVAVVFISVKLHPTKPDIGCSGSIMERLRYRIVNTTSR